MLISFADQTHIAIYPSLLKYQCNKMASRTKWTYNSAYNKPTLTSHQSERTYPKLVHSYQSWEDAIICVHFVSYHLLEVVKEVEMSIRYWKKYKSYKMMVSNKLLSWDRMLIVIMIYRLLMKKELLEIIRIHRVLVRLSSWEIILVLGLLSY